ncbi:MAG: hypothetical protein Q4P32_06765 [Micrococcales bacterium]|nr:hypothetical protein [Micrococcales bacterium]
MSDLQCAATLYVLGSQAAEPDDLPEETRAAAVWAAPSRSAQGERFARRWGCVVRVEPGLEVRALPLAAQDPYEEIADQHRGESVLVLPAHPYAGHRADDWIRVRIDGDGREVRVLP